VLGSTEFKSQYTERERKRERKKKRKKKEQIHSFYESIKINQQTIFFKKLLISSLYRTELQPE
jgi:hypothetical protein